MVVTLGVRALFLIGTLTAGAETPNAVNGNSAAVVAGIFGVIIAVITSGALVYNNRTSGAEERAKRHKLEAQLWEARARLKGWSEDKT